MPTVADLSEKFKGVVLLHWHPPCVFVKTDPQNHPEEDIYGQSHEEALFRRLTYQTHRRHLIPTRKSRRLLRDQADRLVALDLVPDRIGHSQHRLAEHAAEEFTQQLLRGPSGKLRTVLELPWLNPPTYMGGLRRVINRDGTFVRYWFNGVYEVGEVAVEEPEQWLTNFVYNVDDEIERGRVSLLFTHYEQLVAAHAFFIANQEPPCITDSWSPDFGGGIAVYDDGEQFRGATYDEMFNLV